MTDKNVIITLKDDDNNVLVIPVTPSKVTATYGDAAGTTVNILDRGEAAYGEGKNLDGYSWGCFFPTRYDKSYCNCTPKAPAEYIRQINAWKKNATVIRVIIPVLGINEAVKVKSFTGDYRGADLDFYYNITLQQYVAIKCITVANKAVSVTENRPALPASTEITKGMKVHFNGGPVYYSSNASEPRVTRGAADCNVTATYNGKHQVHLIHYSGDMVYGWCDPANCTVI